MGSSKVNMKALMERKLIPFHFQWVKNGMKTYNLYDFRMINHVSLATKRESPENSCEMVDKRPQEAVVTWTSWIADCVKMGWDGMGWDSLKRPYTHFSKCNDMASSRTSSRSPLFLNHVPV